MSKKIFITSCIIIQLVLLFSFIGSFKKNDESLAVGTNAEFYPFSFIENGKIVGFDIDIASEVCKRLGKEIEVKDMSFDVLIPQLTLGYIDFIAAGMTYTEERNQYVSFTTPYFSDDPLIILTVAKDESHHIKSLSDFQGQTIIVNEGYTADLFLSSKKEFNLIRLSSPADAFIALKNGRADAFVTARSTVLSFLESQKAGLFHYDVISDTADSYSLVISKKNTQLLDAIQKVLNEMEHEGLMDELKTKWKLK
jgi:ABC-type amino acid transport substrate-binding protein